MWAIFLKGLFWICYNIVSVVCVLVFWPQGTWESQLPDGGANPYPLHWKAKFYPLDHQGSPWLDFLNNNFVRCNSHTIKFSHFKCRIQRLLVYSPVQQLSHWILEQFCQRREEHHTPSHQTTSSPAPLPQAVTSYSIGLLAFDMS